MAQNSFRSKSKKSKSKKVTKKRSKAPSKSKSYSKKASRRNQLPQASISKAAWNVPQPPISKSIKPARPKRPLRQRSVSVNTVSYVNVAPKEATVVAPEPSAHQESQERNVPALAMMAPVGESPQMVQCPQCGQQLVTQTVPTPGTFTYLIALITLPCCCCCIPFLFDGTKDVEHRCSGCGCFLGKWSRF